MPIRTTPTILHTKLIATITQINVIPTMMRIRIHNPFTSLLSVPHALSFLDLRCISVTQHIANDVDFGNPVSVFHDYAVNLRMLGEFKSRFAPDDFVLCFDEKYAKLRVSFVFSSCLCLFWFECSSIKVATRRKSSPEKCDLL